MGLLDGIASSAGSAALVSATQGLMRFIPEPKSRTTSSFSSLLGGAQSATSEIGSSIGALPGDLPGLLAMQMQIQMQMETVSLISNVSKAQSDMEMAPIRNIRVD